MSTKRDTPLLQIIRDAVFPFGDDQISDRELLRRFAEQRDESAFTALVRRHGAMVLGVGMRVLRRHQDAEDVCQATFLLLARKASAVPWRDSVVNWLYGAAFRLALQTRDAAHRCAVREKRIQPKAPPDAMAEIGLREFQDTLDRELSRLPQKYASLLLLCCLEGRTRDEAARSLGLPLAMVKSRLEEGRELLRRRLARRGVELTTVLASVTVCSLSASAALPALLIRATSDAAVKIYAGEPIAELVSASVMALTTKGIQTMFLAKFKVATVLLLGVGIAATGIVSVLQNMPVRAQADARPKRQTPGAEKKPLPNAKPTAKPDDAPAAVDAKMEQTPRLDAFGDSLPPGAVARLGSTRFVHDSHASRVNRLVISGDGEWIVCDAASGNRMWNSATGQELVLPENLKQAPVFATNRSLVAIKREKGRAILWSLPSQKELARVELNIAPDDSAALSPDGKAIIWVNDRWEMDPVRGIVVRVETLRCADTTTGALMYEFNLQPSPANRPAIVFSENSAVMATSSWHVIDVWDTRTGKLLLSEDLRGQPPQFALSPDGSTLATTNFGENRVRFFSVREKKERAALPLPKSNSPQSKDGLAFSPDGKFLAVTYGTTFGLWDLASRREVLRSERKLSNLGFPTFSPDGNKLATNDDERIRFWDLKLGDLCHDFGHTYSIAALAFAPDGKTIATGAAYTDKVVRLWDPLTGKIKSRLAGHRSGMEAIAYSPDGTLLATGSLDGTVKLWDAKTDQEIASLEANDGMIYGLAFSEDGKAIFSGGRRKAIHVWDVATRKEVRAIDNPGSFVVRLAASPDGKYLATFGVGEKSSRLWDMNRGVQIGTYKEFNLRFSYDGTLLAFGSDDGGIDLVDLPSRQPLRSLELKQDADKVVSCGNVHFSPDGRSLAVNCSDGTLRILELLTGQERARFSGRYWSFGYSFDGALFATGKGESAIVWDIYERHLPDRKPVGLTQADQEQLWNALSETQADRAFRAMKTLIANPETAVALLQSRLQPAAAVDTENIAGLVADLDDAQFAKRENATERLRELGELAETMLRVALQRDLSLEAATRRDFVDMAP